MNEAHAGPGPEAEPPRRNFMASALSLIFGGVVSVFPFLAGLFSFLDPITRKRSTPKLYAANSTDGPEGFTRVCALEALDEQGPPQRFPVIADQSDGWNFTPNQPIGAVFIERTGPQEVRVFNSSCPHAGCSVACDGSSYACPCHNSAFNLDGTKRVSTSGRENPSPRALDSLQVDPNQLAQGEVWVQFMNFYIGKEEKIPKL